MKRHKRYQWVSLSRTDRDTSDVARILGVVFALADQGYSDGQIAETVGLTRPTAARYRHACAEILRMARTIEEVGAGVDGRAIVGAEPSVRAVRMRAR